ncbi:unnamed protein product [Rotaria sp. Silwood2]|nr:unnamed protein product [Rotaria sp. Silwood2]CAF2756535.1 unnamed protein product [Rotaria sp. Silwood2]CAF3919773.1 unnamed protein product [Rotaria sp. Silwood2]CAF4057563.1 unnamed protein product [Rotaria sp. Silwood2]
MTDQQNETSTTISHVTTSTVKTGLERLAQLYPHITEDTPLPSKWNSKEKAPPLVLQQSNLVVTYKGPGKSHKDAASVRSDHPIPSLAGIYYYEVKIISKGRDGYMGIGLSTSEVNLNRLPGWDKGSYGYHGDDGHSFCSSGSGIAYGPTFTTGDFVGCCSEIYPTIGLQTPLEAIEANFGLSPFKFDIEKYMGEYREKTRRAIVECTLKEGELLHQIQLRRIVSTYLVHYGYCDTAEQFNKNAENVYADELNSMRNRQLIQNLILDGHTTDAIEKTKELFPTLLNNKNLLFVLKVRQFIEMINGTESEISKPSITSQITNSSLINHKNHSNSSCSNKNSSCAATTNERSSSPVNKSNTSSRSRSNSPYTSGRNQTTNSEEQQQQHSNGTINSSSRRSSANNNESSQEIITTVNSLPTYNNVTNLMDIDDEIHANNTTNGFSNHGTVSSSSSSSSSSSASSSTNQISNGHLLFDDDSNNLIIDKNTNSNGCLTKSTETFDRMECDGINDLNHTMDIEKDSSDVQEKDDQLLVKILQFGRELLALKQQLNNEHGDNTQHDKILQDAFSLLAYPDPKSSPLAHLLEPSQRESVSSILNSAILEAHDMPRHPALEVLVGYLNECDKLMHKNNIPDCAFVELNKYVR